MTPHDKTLSALLAELKTDEKSGLSSQEAAARLARDGENRLREGKKKTNLQRFAEQFKDVMILILLAAAVISFIVACSTGEPSEFFEPLLIVAIVIANAVMGVMQESKAEKALEALKNLSAPHARVLRDGKEAIVDASKLVVGDIVLLEAGDFVPADARLLTSSSLKSEESALTGESVPSEKDAEAVVAAGAPLGDRHNMVYSGCSITYGRATAVVTATAMNTEMGKIAGLLDASEDGQTPLQQKLANMGKYLGIVALAACAVIFVLGLLDGIPVMEIFMTAVSLAVSAIPEGLPAIVTIVLAIGVQRMVKKNAIIRRLPAVLRRGHLLGEDRHPHPEPHDLNARLRRRRGGNGGHLRQQLRAGPPPAAIRGPVLRRLGGLLPRGRKAPGRPHGDGHHRGRAQERHGEGRAQRAVPAPCRPAL